ncbi:phosphopantothenoylcysteine decarboxylase [Mastigocladus laminosus UU774]|nr:phosphopantothenoylcysteine decarboxylase [Mastigocladus laminosus UU774]
MKEDPIALIRKTKLLVGVCGGVAALGTPHALLWARSALGLEKVQVLLTPMASRMVNTKSFEVTMGLSPIVEWEDLAPGAAPHIRLAHWPDTILVLPATANLLGKLAHGIADSLLTTTLLAASCPITLAPAMNPAMWRKPVVQRNVEQLRADGYEIIPPGEGKSLTSGDTQFGSIEDVRRPFIIALSRAIRELTEEVDLNVMFARGDIIHE